LAETKGGLETELEHARRERDNAIKRVEELKAQGNRPDAEEALRELRDTGDMAALQTLLIEERDRHKDALIQRNREIVAVAYLRGDIDIAAEACNEILRLDANDLDAINYEGRIHLLRGELDQAVESYSRIIEIALAQKDEMWKAIAFGNLGLIYLTRGDLDRAEEMYNPSSTVRAVIHRQNLCS